MTEDLAPALVEAALPGRAVRAYPALLSTEAEAMAWARHGAPPGAVVVADYQAAPRGRGGLPWSVHPGCGLGFTLIVRPPLPQEREGWPYVAGLLGLDDVVGAANTVLEWPDTLLDADGEVLARLGVYGEPGGHDLAWVSLTVLVEDALPPRAELLANVLEALEGRLAQSVDEVLAAYRPRCATLGRQCRARLIPMGPGGPEVTGEAVDVLADGALVLLTVAGRRVAVPPHNLGRLEAPQGPVEPPDRPFGRAID